MTRLDAENPHPSASSPIEASREAKLRLQAELALRHSELLYTITSELAGCVRPRDVAKVVANDVRKLVGASSVGVVQQVDSEEVELVEAGGYENFDLPATRRFPISLPYPAFEVIRSKKSQWLPTREELVKRFPKVVFPPDTQALAVFPLRTRDDVFGALAMHFAESHLFDDDERNFLSSIADLCSQGFDRCLIYEREETARRSVEAAYERSSYMTKVAGILVSSLNLAENLEKVAQLMLPQWGEFCAIELFDDPGKHPELAIVVHVEPEKASSTLELMRQLFYRRNRSQEAKRGVKAGEPELLPMISDARLEAANVAREQRETAKALGYRSALVVPLLLGGEVIGTFTLASGRLTRLYGQEDLDFAQRVAVKISQSISNARLYEEMQRALKAREEIMSVVSHDLLNPLTTVHVTTELLEARVRKGLFDDIGKHLQRIRDAAERAERLIHDLHDADVIESGTLLISPQSVDFAKVLSRLCEDFAAQANEKGLLFACRGIEEPLPIVADTDRLYQVVANLLSNAVKHTPKGKKITLSLFRDKEWVELEVHNEGSFIPETDRSKIFKKNVQREQDRGRGLGLGLFIAHGIALAHGGDLTVESSENEGVTFCLHLPVSSASGAL